MTSWHYAFMFAGPGGRLCPDRAIEEFFQSGFEFDDIVRPATIIDDEGHLEYMGELHLSGNKQMELQTRLKEAEQFQVECRNRDVFFSISFGTRYSNPYIMIGWSRKVFGTIAEADQRRYLRLLRQFAKLCQAVYVVIVDDPPDYFEDRFIEIDGQRFLDDRMPSGKKYEIHGIWVDESSGGFRPEGVPDSTGIDIGDGFTKYEVGRKTY
jgi:hypothetical protein